MIIDWIKISIYYYFSVIPDEAAIVLIAEGMKVGITLKNYFRSPSIPFNGVGRIHFITTAILCGRAIYFIYSTFFA